MYIEIIDISFLLNIKEENLMSSHSITTIKIFYDYLNEHKKVGQAFVELLNECSKDLEDSKEPLKNVSKSMK
jgi:hypothetical protein